MADKNSAPKMYSDIDPRTELVEGEGFNTFLVYVPGFKKEELKIEVDDTSRYLKVTGSRNLDGNKWFRFEKKFPVPMDCEINNIKAKIDNGVLYLVVLKSPASDQTPRQVSIKPVGGVVRTLLKHKLVILNAAIAAILLVLVLFGRGKLADGDNILIL